MEPTTNNAEHDSRELAYALVRTVFNGSAPAEFSNFFADICSMTGQADQLYKVAERCFEEMAKREAERIKSRLTGRFYDLLDN